MATGARSQGARARARGATARETARLPTYVDFRRDEWRTLRAAMPLTLSEADLASLHGVDEAVSMREVEEVYLPIARLLSLRVAAARELGRVTDTFLGRPARSIPFVIGLAGSVSVGKSTTARILRALLARGADHPRVELVTTDGFLWPNRVLKRRGLMARKGFPESYDLRRLLRFVADLKAGRERLEVPLYSHRIYDVVPGEAHVLERPDVVIVEGLNVLQTDRAVAGARGRLFVSDFFDFSVFVDADVRLIRRWFVDRFLALRRAAAGDPGSYFVRYAALTSAEATRLARRVFREINEVNLRENIAPTRERAHLILEKGADHTVERLRLRQV